MMSWILLALHVLLLLNLYRVLFLGSSSPPSSAIRRPHGGLTAAHAPSGDASGALPGESRARESDPIGHSGFDFGHLGMASEVPSPLPSFPYSGAALTPGHQPILLRSRCRCRTARKKFRGLLRGDLPEWAENDVVWVRSDGSRGWH